MTKNKPNVVLVRLANPNMNLITPPLGIGYLLKVLSKIDGIDPVFLDCKLDKIDDSALLTRLEDLAPLMVGFQVFSVDYNRFTNLLPIIKEQLPETIIVAGGPHVSGLPMHTLNTNPEIDYLISGEGEEALPMLAQYHQSNSKKIDIDKIPNLVHRKGTSCVQNEKQYVDVNTYGAPAWELLQPDRYPPIQHGTFHKSKRVVPILTSRGCPYPCTFCAGHLMTGKKIRLREIGSLVDEIELLINEYNFEEFIIEDENFTFYKSHVLQFADELKRRKIKCFFSFPNGIRLDRLDEEIIARMAEMGTYVVGLGIESGSSKTLGNMKKKSDFDLIYDRVKLLKKYGIIVSGSFIVGYRDETIDDIKQTIKQAVRLPIDMAYLGNYIPLPGTEDFDILLKRGELILDQIPWENYNSYVGVFPYHPKEISEADLRKAIKIGTLRFYLRPRIVFGILSRMTSIVFVKSFFVRMYNIIFQN